MGSKTVDKLQKELQEKVFHYAKDSKKAAGRALGTLIEIVTYYKICSWGFSGHVVIERPVPEFGRSDIAHNVEFSLHLSKEIQDIDMPIDGKAISARKISQATNLNLSRPAEILLSKDKILKNSALLDNRHEGLRVANIVAIEDNKARIRLSCLEKEPKAIFECKRVGVEEGMKKGPQSIEKAKQGAYVARSVSALQKVISADGTVYGFYFDAAGEKVIIKYDEAIESIVTGKLDAPQGFVLTVGVASNHGNWFTAENQNKELKILCAAYDWLLFLTDEGLMKFVDDCILEPIVKLRPVRQAFLSSYSGKKGRNRFTKTKLDLDADRALRAYFGNHQKDSDKWFNVLTPVNVPLEHLSDQLKNLLGRIG